MANNNSIKVFVVSEHWEWETDVTTTNIVGVYLSRFNAEKAMLSAYQEEKKSWLESVVEDESDIESFVFSGECTLFNEVNSVDFYEVKISEKELAD